MSTVIRVIPCLDVNNGRVVKGVNFENLRDAGDPAELAHRYNNAGADEITFLDVTATTEQRDTTYDLVNSTAKEVFIPSQLVAGSVVLNMLISCFAMVQIKCRSVLRQCLTLIF